MMEVLTDQKVIYRDSWDNWYQGINQANGVINRSADVEMDEAQKTLRIAEVRFLRAFYYFNVVTTFGDAHLSLEETVGIEVEANRTSQAEIYSQAIVPDLEFAIANLPDEQRMIMGGLQNRQLNSC